MAYIIIFSPLLGFLIAGLIGRKIGDFASQLITCFLVFVSTVISFYYLYQFVFLNLSIISSVLKIVAISMSSIKS